ncbi:MAG: RND family efflux transporter MFP subunit [Arcobacteraceae bacterium]|jgi:RND family efflux transporter MFP subunit
MINKLVILVGIAIYSFGAGAPQASLVNTAKVIKGEVNPLEEFIGTLKFSKTSAVASQTNGVVDSINFEAGDKLKKGDVLLQIDSEILDAQIVSLKASVNIAKIDFENTKKDYNRYKELMKQKSISVKVYDDSYYRFNTSKQNLNMTEAKLNEQLINKVKKTIKAPYDAVVIEQNIELAEWASAGKTIATIVSTNEVDLIFNLPSSYIYKLNKKDNYEIDLKGEKIVSKLYANIAKGDTRTRTFPVKFKAKVNDDFLYDGMEVKINLPRTKKQTALMVPRDAVIKRFGQDVIFLNVKGIANMLPVQILGYTLENVAVSAKGLSEGASVVVKGNERIFPKQAIKSLNQQK